jgi:hypothetical protein
MKKAGLTLTFFIALLLQSKAQKTSFFFGNNATYFSDWKKKPLTFFNPEIIFQKYFDKNFIAISVDGFYGTPNNQKMVVGDVIDRLIFTLKCNYSFKFNNTSIGAGPSCRHRTERKILYFYPPINPFEMVTDPDRTHFDVGINGSLQQLFNIGKKTSLSIKLSYSIFNEGENPLSFGVFYGWKW